MTNTASQLDSLFCYQGLGHFLSRVQLDRPIVRLGDWAGERAAILRHDIDLDLEPAARLCEQLSQWGIVSTYLVLTTSPHYNPASARSRSLMRKIVQLGGEIGLHFDPTHYPNASLQDLESGARDEARWLESLSGAPVRSLSLHNPHALTEKHLLDGFVNAYDPKIFESGRYLSDSCRRFRTDPWDFCNRLESIEGPVQILLHPMHYHEQARTYAGIFQDYFAQVQADCSSNFGPANATYLAETNLG